MMRQQQQHKETKTHSYLALVAILLRNNTKKLKLDSDTLSGYRQR